VKKSAWEMRISRRTADALFSVRKTTRRPAQIENIRDNGAAAGVEGNDAELTAADADICRTAPGTKSF